jgi:hypothetical protein
MAPIGPAGFKAEGLTDQIPIQPTDSKLTKMAAIKKRKKNFYEGKDFGKGIFFWRGELGSPLLTVKWPLFMKLCLFLVHRMPSLKS